MLRVLKVIGAIVLFFLLNSMIQEQFEFDGKKINEWTLSSSEGIESITMPFNRSINTPEIVNYEITTDTRGYDSLVIPQMSGYAIKVYVNEELRYRVGSFDIPTSNIWMNTHIVSLPKGDELAESNIRIQSYGLHDIGIKGMTYLANYEDVNAGVGNINFFNSGLILLLMGGYGAVGVLLLLMSRKSHAQKNKEDMQVFFNYGLACISFMFFMFDSMSRMSTGSLFSLMLTRKSAYVGLFAGIYFLLNGTMRHLIYKPVAKWVKYIFMTIGTIMFLMPTFALVRIASAVMIPLLFVVLTYILKLSFLNKKNGMIVTGTFLYATVIHSIVINITSINGAYLFHYGLFAYMMAITYIIANKYELSEKATKDMSEKMVIDPLTKAYNRSYLAELKLNESNLAVFIDLDKFKDFNDNFGHDAGDKLLKRLVIDIWDVFGKNQSTIRYGGDEFIVILDHYTIEAVDSGMEEVKKQLRSIYKDADFSYGLIKYESSLAETLILADHKMYEMKRNKAGLKEE